MKIDLDNLVSLINQITGTPKEEMGEQEDTGGGGTGGYPTVTKWETGITRGLANPVKVGKWKDLYQTKRGKANTLL